MCAGKLEKATEVVVVGKRIRTPKGSPVADKASKVSNRAEVPVSVQLQGLEAVKAHLDLVKVGGLTTTL